VSRRSWVIGIDCSTTATWAIVFNREGAVVAEGRSTCPLSRPHPRPGWHEQDPADWWTSAAAAVREAVASVDPRDVAFGITHQRESFVCLNEGVAYQLRLQREGVDAALGEPLDHFVARGGSRSAAWCQMVADVVGVPVTLSHEAMHRRYDPFFTIYPKLHPRLRDVFKDIARAISAEGGDG
jgi:sugar (pentulose or hexulose) kinase